MFCYKIQCAIHRKVSLSRSLVLSVNAPFYLAKAIFLTFTAPQYEYHIEM